ncbi:MAG TPA: glucokinase [Bryobacteraceae bacterium]|nr:glucokinase [Bryobacteraceae bacterium]
MILAGDIGGTNTRLAFFEGTPDRLTAEHIQIFPSAQFSGPTEIVRRFLASTNVSLDAACFGLPGAVVNGRVETTNLPWVVDSNHMAADLGIQRIKLVNDLLANAHGIALLEESDLVVLNPGMPGSEGNRALISAGTGLGEAGLYADDRGYYHPFASEGGHSDFAPRNDLEMDLLRYLMGRFEHVSYERVLSGPGLHNVYLFLRDTGRGTEPPWLSEQIAQGDPSAAISKSALEGTSEICVQALDIFVALYGAEAGNLALKVLATGGMYVGGGIAPKIIRKLSSTTFMKAFSAKGRKGSLLKDIPVRVITNDKTALLGAGRVAAMLAAGR